MPSRFDRSDRSWFRTSGRVRRVTPALTILTVQKVDRTPRGNIRGGGYHCSRPRHGNFYWPCRSFPLSFSLRLHLPVKMTRYTRHRTTPMHLSRWKRDTLANFTCTTLSGIELSWLYSFTPSVTAALLPNLPRKERSGELGWFLFGNLFENLPSSSVPGEPETILGVRMHSPFPREYRLLPIVFWMKWMKTD